MVKQACRCAKGLSPCSITVEEWGENTLPATGRMRGFLGSLGGSPPFFQEWHNPIVSTEMPPIMVRYTE
jgi:hypothetical protein